jgi:hypothetical protein
MRWLQEIKFQFHPFEWNAGGRSQFKVTATLLQLHFVNSINLQLQCNRQD